MTDVNPLSIVSIFLTLASLVGTFFYLQLSQWLRDLLGLEQKAQLNAPPLTDPQKRAIIECRIELRRLDNGQTYFVNSAVIVFVLFVLILSLVMIQSAVADPAYIYVLAGLVGFTVVFIVLSAVLLTQGVGTARRLREKLA